MINELETKNAFLELSIILENMDNTLLNKIPNKLIELITENKNPEHKFQYNFNKSLNEQDFMPLTKKILSVIYLMYICEENKRSDFFNTFAENDVKLQNKYNPNNLFKESQTSPKEPIHLKNSDLAIHHESFFQKILNKIRKLL